MAQEGEYDSCPAEGLNFNMTHISEYQLLGFFILVLGLGIGLGIGLIVVVGWILYHKFGAPVPSAVPSASARQVWSSSINDGSPNSHDQSLTEGPMSDYNSNALKALRRRLKDSVVMEQLVDILEPPAGGFMNPTEAQSVCNARSQMGKLIEILLSKGDKEFNTFCDMLQESNHCAWAVELKQKAEWYRKKNQTNDVNPAYDVATPEAGDHKCLRNAPKNAKLIRTLYRDAYHGITSILANYRVQDFSGIMATAKKAIQQRRRDVRALTTADTVAKVLYVLHDDEDWKDTQSLQAIVQCIPDDEGTKVIKGLLCRYNSYLAVYKEEVPGSAGLPHKGCVCTRGVHKEMLEVTMARNINGFTFKDLTEVQKLLLHNSLNCREEDILDVEPGSTTVVFLIDKVFIENIFHFSHKARALWVFQELSVTRLRVGAFELNVVQLLTQHFKEALRSGLTGGMDFVCATKALPYQVYALVDPDISERMVIRTINRKVAEPCPEQEELVSGTADSEGVETTPEMHEDNLPPKVKEEAELDDEEKIKEATDSGGLLSRVQELEDELKNSEWKRMDLTQKNMALVNHLQVCQEEKDHSQQEMASVKKRLVSMLSSQGGADKDSALIAPSEVHSKRIPRRWWLKVSAGSYDTSLLPSSPMDQREGSREMEGEVVFRRDTTSNLLKAVSGTEWMYQRGALERGRRANLCRHRFTRYHRRWLADNVQKEEEESCKLWLLHWSPDVSTVMEGEEHGADERKMIEEVTGSGKLLSRVQKLENKLKDSEQKRMDLIQENTNLQKILKACREQEDHTRQEMANLKELLSVLSSQSMSTSDPIAGAMREAAEEGNQSIVRLLVKQFVNVEDQDGRTPLLLAVEGGHTDLVRLLTEQYEGDIFHKMKNSRNALHLAADRGHLPVFQYLCSMFGDRVLDRDSNDESCLNIAQRLGRKTIIEFFTQNYLQLEDKTLAQHEDNVPPEVEEEAEPDDKGKIEQGSDSATPVQVVQDHAEEFLQEMNSAVLAPQLKALGLIPETVENKVLRSKNKKDANAHLLNHLNKGGSEETVMEVFRIASEQEGYGRMKVFAASMLRNLQRELERPPTWLHDYEEAVKKQGSVKVAINCCIFAGPPGKGKSCLKHLLVHDKPKEVKTSTGVMEKPDVVTISAEKYAVEETSVWLPLTDDKMASSIKSSCQKRKYHIPEDGPKDQYGKLAQPIIEINPSTAASKATSRSSRADPSDSESDSLDLQPSANTADVSAFQQAHFRLMRDPSLGEGILLNGAQFVHLLDTGGQPSFQAVLPLLLAVPCTYVLVFNAAENLNAPVPITYRPDDTTVVESGSRPETAWAMMLRSLSSVYTLVHKVSGDVRALLVDNRLPPLRTVLVGTFADQLEQMGNIATATEEISRQIEQLKNKPYYSSLIPNSDGQLFHLVNNLPRQEVSERTRREQASINNLREVLSHPAGAVNAKIPIGWYQFEMVSRLVDQKFFDFSELLDHARELKCITSADPSREFRSLLLLFHSLGVFTFIDREDVSHMVCTDSSVFLQVVSKLLAVEFKVPKCFAVKIFKETGILSLDTSLFNELGISKEVDPVWLLRCLCYLGVAACISLPSADTPEYFIPAALPSEDKENVSEHGSVAPLLVAFQFQAHAFLSMEDLPHGIFARLAVELANKGWKVIRKINTRLAIRFRWKSLCISIVESAGCIRIVPIVSVHAKCSVAELHEHCTAMRSTVEAAIQTSAQAVFGSKFTEKAKPIFAFECPCEVSPTHFAVTSGEDTLVCHLSSEYQEYLTSQRVWFCPIEGAQLQPHPSNPKILQLVGPTSRGGGGAAKFPVSELLAKHEPEFFSVVNARFSLRRLKHLGVITQDVMAHIDAATNEEDAQEILYEHLANHASVDTLMKYCEVIMAADGSPTMQSLGRKMTEELQPKEEREDTVCVP